MEVLCIILNRSIYIYLVLWDIFVFSLCVYVCVLSYIMYECLFTCMYACMHAMLS